MNYVKGYILDHWGKGSPSAAETAVLDLEVEILKQQERDSRRGKESTMIFIYMTTVPAPLTDALNEKPTHYH